MKNIKIENILNAVCDYFDIDKSCIISRKRTRKQEHAIRCYYVLCKKLTNDKLFTIGCLIGRKHSVVSRVFNGFKNNKIVLNDVKFISHKIKKQKISDCDIYFEILKLIEGTNNKYFIKQAVKYMEKRILQKHV